MAIPSQIGVSTIIVTIVFEVLALLAIGLRVWSRRIQRLQFALNDYAAFIAALLTSGLSAVLLTIMYSGGYGYHVQELQPQELLTWSRGFFAGQLLWAAANTAVKVSLLHLYITVFRGQVFTRICYAIMGLTGAYLAMVILEAFLLCTPVALNWDAFATGTCVDTRLAFTIAGIVNLVIDATVIALPMPKLWHLQMPLAKKVGLTFIFGIGALILVVTVFRVVTIWNYDASDSTYNAGVQAIWSLLEPALGVVNACLPVIRPGVKKMLRSPALAWTGVVSGVFSSHGSRWSGATTGPRGGRPLAGDRQKSADRYFVPSESQRSHGSDGTLAPEDGGPMVRLNDETDSMEKAQRTNWPLPVGGGQRGSAAIRVQRSWEVESHAGGNRDSVARSFTEVHS